MGIWFDERWAIYQGFISCWIWLYAVLSDKSRFMGVTRNEIERFDYVKRIQNKLSQSQLLDFKKLYSNLYNYESKIFIFIYSNVVGFTDRSIETMGKKIVSIF